MQSLVAEGLADAVAVADPDPAARAGAAALVPGAGEYADLDALLDAELDGLVIATPSALHAEQAVAALERGIAVFCQKPLARTAAETAAVLGAARRADRLLGVDLSYRETAAGRRLHALARAGELGELYAAELVFHNAYGPDKPWFLDRRRSGGGCVIDLATHLVDLVLWTTGSAEATVEHAVLRRAGRPLAGADEVEDFATAQLRLDTGATVRLACSWFLPAGRDCAIECTLTGTQAAAALVNVGGSFYDFQLERRDRTSTEVLVEPPDAWGGRALAAWTRRLRQGAGFDEARAREHLALARAIDDIYLAGGVACGS
jgi:predicted dehydrogenase